MISLNEYNLTKFIAYLPKSAVILNFLCNFNLIVDNFNTNCI